MTTAPPDPPPASSRGHVGCVVVAAGRGERLGADRPKAFTEVAGRPLIWRAAQAIAQSALVGHVVAVVPAGREADTQALLSPVLRGGATSSLRVVAGGGSRQESVARGLAGLPDEVEVVLVHDAARCLAPPQLYDAVATAVIDHHDAVVPGIDIVDTLKEVDDHGVVMATPPRSRLRAVQTPQGFRRAVLVRAHQAAERRQVTDAPDDAALVERLGLAVHVVPGHHDAFKVTRSRDLRLAESVLADQERSTAQVHDGTSGVGG